MNVKVFFLMIVGISNYRIGGESEVGFYSSIGSRLTNEDRFVATPHCLAVYDCSAGPYLSEFMKTKTEEILKQQNTWDNLKTICSEGQKYAESLVQKDFEQMHDNWNKKFFSTTAAIAYINEQKKLNICWVGDTRIVLVNNNNNIVFETKDHKPNRPDEAGRLIALQNKLEEEGLWEKGDLPICTPANFSSCNKTVARARNSAISRVIGCVCWAEEESVINEPEFYEKDLDSKDAFIINACDGLWDVFSSQQAVKFVREKLNANMDLNDICKALVTAALKRGSTDNITVTLMLLHYVNNK